MMSSRSRSYKCHKRGEKKLVGEDPAVKGIWCVPLYSNPTGAIYSDECVTRLAKMKTAAKDFQIFWDNAYCVHHLYKKHTLLNIYREAERFGTTDRILYFASTAKVTYPGSSAASDVYKRQFSHGLNQMAVTLLPLTPIRVVQREY